ncbi:MAG: diguanylate cyclase (GGDEF)-like protein [Oleispira sp.]|jgi:diguanylate cyclase (GGDEF)-like protein
MMKVLIVDDDVIDRTSIVRILKSSESAPEIIEVETAEEGLHQLKIIQFDVILLDYNLPKKSGMEFLLELKSDSAIRNTAVIMMSTSEEEKLALDCISSGAQDFLAKTEITAFRLRRAILSAQARSELEQELYQSYQKTKKLAECDSLTGLANRYLFDESLVQSISDHQRSGNYLALILLDLDHFKYINDNYGHDVGDELLIKVTTRINSCLRGNELFARLGGDEFSITLLNIKSPQDANSVTLRILNSLKMPFQVGDITVMSTASIGISLYPGDGENATDLFKHADVAMYRAKNLGRNQHSFYEQKMQNQFLIAYEIEKNLRESIDKEEFILFYQPVITLATMEVTGFEALLRWPKYSDIGPDIFIPIAEKSLLIIDLGRWVISAALKQLSEWNKRSAEPMSIAINLSPVQLSDPELIHFIANTLKQNKISPKQVEFELTETALFVESDLTSNSIKALSDLGCRIALDDFGTGFSSLSHLHNYPINTVKIDKSLMPSSSSNEASERLVTGLVLMINSLGLDIIAEGVEEKKDLDMCKSLAINKVQGYYFNYPLTVSDIELHYFNN